MPEDNSGVRAAETRTPAELLTTQVDTKGNSRPRVPDVSGLSVLNAALAYAEAGLYVGPLKHRSKNPGSILADWDTQTSRDPEAIRRWFPPGTDRGLFLHCGRSGVVVFDVDHPDQLHPLIVKAVADCSPPWQNTRPADPDRRHYLFAMPDGRMLGNSTVGLGGDWGQVRGRNGVIVVAPSVHEEDKGRYAWGHTGAVPVLPGYVADVLPDARVSTTAATGQDVSAFLVDHIDGSRTELLDICVRSWLSKVQLGESRHDSMTGHLAGAMKEAAAGYYPASLAADTLESVFLDAVGRDGLSEQQGGARSNSEAASEWAGLLGWAVAQASAAPVEETRARVAERWPTAEQDFAVPLRDAPVPVSGVLARFPRLSMAELLDPNRPPREYVVDPLLAAGSSASMVAPAGQRKSLLAMALALAVARGDDEFAGMPIPKARRVCYLDMENTQDDLRERLLSFGVTQHEALDRFILVSLPDMKPLDTAQGGEDLLAVVRAYGLEPGDLLVLDSYQRVTQAAENDSDTTRGYYRHTGVRLKAHGLTVLRLDNTGKNASKGARGSSGKRDDVDAEYLLKSDGDCIEFAVGKGRQQGVVGLSIYVRTDADGRTTFRSGSFSPARVEARSRMSECIAQLDRLDVPLDASQRAVEKALEDAGDTTPREIQRKATSVRRERDEKAARDFAADGA